MKIGDKVKLKNVLHNDRKWLEEYKNKIGVVTHCDTCSSPQYVRVEFEGFFLQKVYEDLSTCRLENVGVV